MPLSLYYVGDMKIFTPDPYTISRAVAMYYTPPIRRVDQFSDVIADKARKEKSPRHKVQPSENIGRNVDTYA